MPLFIVAGLLAFLVFCGLIVILVVTQRRTVQKDPVGPIPVWIPDKTVWGPGWAWGILAFLFLCSMVNVFSGEGSAGEAGTEEAYLEVSRIQDGSSSFSFKGKGAESVTLELWRIEKGVSTRISCKGFESLNDIFTGRFRVQETRTGKNRYQFQLDAVADASCTTSSSRFGPLDTSLLPLEMELSEGGRIPPGPARVLFRKQFSVGSVGYAPGETLRELRMHNRERGGIEIACTLRWRSLNAQDHRDTDLTDRKNRSYRTTDPNEMIAVQIWSNAEGSPLVGTVCFWRPENEDDRDRHRMPRRMSAKLKGNRFVLDGCPWSRGGKIGPVGGPVLIVEDAGQGPHWLDTDEEVLRNLLELSTHELIPYYKRTIVPLCPGEGEEE